MAAQTSNPHRILPVAMALAARIALVMALWLVISEFERQLFSYGMGTAVVVALVSIRLVPVQAPGLSVTGLLRFIPYFAWYSFLGGLDVAWRACHPRLPISPCTITHPVSLQSGTGRTLLLLIVSLLPGTLAVRIQDQALKVHCLDARGNHANAIAMLERRIAGMFRHETLTGNS